MACSTPLLLASDTGSGVPTVWPAPGLLLGLALVVGPGTRARCLSGGAVLLVAVHLVTGFSVVQALGFSAASVLAAAVAWRRLVRGAAARGPGLFEEGDVSRLIASAATGATVAAIVTAGTVALTGQGSPLLGAVAAWSTHAAAMLVLAPLFLPAPDLDALAQRSERVTQSVIIVGVTAAVFAYAPAPPLVFAVMPMFGWLAYRGTPREASRLLAVVALVSSGATVLDLGPVHELGARYDLAPELVIGFLQLFLVDCALLLLPLSVMATQQRLAAARAQAGRLTLQRLVDSATGSAVIATDLAGVVEVFNPGAVSMFMRPAASAIGHSAETLFSDVELHRQAARLGTQPVFVDICRAAIVADGGQEPWHLTGPGGDQRTVLLTITLVSGDHGAPTGFLLVGEDVTEREAAHRAALMALEHERRAVERLTDLERIKADFVATVSHELRTPLTSMIGYLDLMKAGQFGDLTVTQGSVTDRVARNSRRLLLLVEDLLLLSQIETRGMRLNPVPADLGDIVRSALDAVEPTREGRDVDVVVLLPDHDIEVIADPAQLERMVMNLVSNAVKFTPDRGRIEIGLTESDDSAVLVVRDTGIGIPSDEQSLLFTRFFRSSTATARAIQGTGLGLTIVGAIVEAHGGQVEVQSRDGEGTTVTVRLPAGVAPSTVDDSVLVGPVQDRSGRGLEREVERDHGR